MIMNWICTNFRVKTTDQPAIKQQLYDPKDQQPRAPRIYILNDEYEASTMVKSELPLQIRKFLQIAARSTPTSLDLLWIDEEKTRMDEGLALN